MGRLIDADKLMLHLNDYALQEATIERNDSKNQKEIYETIKECMKAVEEQPTAFDVDNIVSNLEQLKLDGACNNEDCVYCKYLNECWDGDMSEEHAINMAIEIVKRGGLDECYDRRLRSSNGRLLQRT